MYAQKSLAMSQVKDVLKVFFPSDPLNASVLWLISRSVIISNFLNWAESCTSVYSYRSIDLLRMDSSPIIQGVY